MKRWYWELKVSFWEGSNPKYVIQEQWLLKIASFIDSYPIFPQSGPCYTTKLVQNFKKISSILRSLMIK